MVDGRRTTVQRKDNSLNKMEESIFKCQKRKKDGVLI
jgi:hypothetical protein